jgi:cysteine desulfurase
MNDATAIYLDHNATTPARPEVVEAMTRCCRQGYANPASQHQFGQAARRALEEARERIGTILGAELGTSHADRVLLTSGGTESNNLALFGLTSAQDSTAGHLILSSVEHSSVLEPAQALMERGWELDTLGATGDGLVRVDALSALLRPETRLVSIMLGNHETGVLQPVSTAATICCRAGIPLHTDAVQVAGKVPINFRALGVSALSIAGHKFGGPLGIGALILREGTPLRPTSYGGHQQWGLRPGTESVELAVGLATALELWHRNQHDELRKLATLRDRFERGLQAELPEIVINGASAPRLPQTSSVAFPGVDGQLLLLALDMVGVACSVGSACSSGASELSPTLRAMGLPNSIVASSLRFSLGTTTTETEIDEATRRIIKVVRELL